MKYNCINKCSLDTRQKTSINKNEGEGANFLLAFFDAVKVHHLFDLLLSNVLR